MYRSFWGTLVLFQISVAELASSPTPLPSLDSLEVFSILLTAEDDGLLYPEFIFLNVSGLVLARRHGPATLHCSITLLGDSAQPRYRVRWATGPLGGQTVAQVDQSKGPEPWVEPAYRDRVTLASHGPHNYLHFSWVTAADFGKYTVTAQVAGSNSEPFTFITMLAEVPHPTEHPSHPSMSEIPSQLSISGTPSHPSTAEVPSHPSISEIPSRPSISEPASRPSSSGPPSHPSISEVPSHPSSTEPPSPPSTAVAPAVPECTPTPHVVTLNTSATVSGFLGNQVTLHCRVITAHACPGAHYRLRWEALETGWDQKQTLTLAQEDQASRGSPRLLASYRNRLNMSSRGPETELRISKLRLDDPEKYRCVAGIAGVDGEVTSRTIHLRKLGRKVWNTHTQTAILILSINVLLFFVILISFRISVLSQSKGRQPPGIVSESHHKMKIFGV
ncbi:uncharacterized protein LOC134338971 [Mobula hypostoma]|uniref:uncharacterized protein LOC134338971 n=1 Tax=Mobula hypostoma TaxID=723540 RepID=UPI002FC3B500